MNKKKYEKAEIEICEISLCDVIVTSGDLEIEQPGDWGTGGWTS